MASIICHTNAEAHAIKEQDMGISEGKNPNKRYIRVATKDEIKTMSTTSWTFFYHKPYQNDWKQAKWKAAGKKWKGLP